MPEPTPLPPLPPLRALIVDDEELARHYLRELLAAHPEVEVVGECKNGFEAVKAAQELGPDLLFLDIQMPKLDGFEVLELLDPAPAVIFVTAYDEHALRAFEVHAVDYLLKPFAPARLAEALARLWRPQVPGGVAPAVTDPGGVGVGSPPPVSAATLSAAARPPGEPLARLVVKDGPRVVVIPVERLDYVEAEDDYVALHSGGESYLKHQTIGSLEAGLEAARFVRIHRSTLINLERLARIEPHGKDTRLAILQDGTELPVSKSGYKRLRELLEG